MADTNERTPLLKVEHLSKEFPAESGMFAKRFSKRVVSAVNDISFEIYPGETFGLVGESGCGKSTTGRTIMRLTKPTAGKVFFQGKDVAEMSKHEIKDMRREMQFIFQDPYASLNPRMTIGEIVSEPMTIHGVGTKEERIERVRELLDVVGLNPEHINRYPHEFSGGQRQRVGIARAFALKPKRRAGFRSGCVHSGPGSEPAQGTAGQVRYRVSVYRSRPVRRAAHFRSRCRYVSG